MTNHDVPAPAVPAWAIGSAGLLSLAVAMGIGRFAFTPMLPLMVQAGGLDVAGGGWVAAANYAGYLLGAWTAARTGWPAPRLALVALAATALLLVAMALDAGAAGWAALRLVAGIASAWAFIGTSSWCLAALARVGPTAWTSTLYAGVGSGIALSGLLCLGGAVAGMGAAGLWIELGLVAGALVLPVGWVLSRLHAATPPGPAPQPAAMPRGGGALVACYAVFGFGYILPATYLPVLARSLVDDPRLFGLAWPVFGTTAVLSTLVVVRVLRRVSRLRVWALSHAAMGLGVLLPSLWLAGWTIAASALLVGGTFMVATLAGVQEMRARASGDATRLLGRMTTGFALGQIAGPVASSLLLRLSPAHGLALALQAGAAALLVSAAWLWRSAGRSSSPLPETVHVR